MEEQASISEEPMVTQKHTYTGFSRGEAFLGLLWLSLGALLSVLLEVVYLGTWIAGVAVPYTIPIAFFFNRVLTKTAMLWTKNTVVALTPLWVWIGGFFLLTMVVSVTGDQLVGAHFRSILLLLVGVAGGGWPIINKK